jgi:iron complex outermembrane receptor protein
VNHRRAAPDEQATNISNEDKSMPHAQCAPRHRFHRHPLSLAAALMLAPTWTLAQTTPTPDAEAKVESVVISAQRRMERLQDVPVAVKAFSARQIEAAGISSTQDFINLTPNMSFDTSFTYGNSFVALRGVTQINNADSPVAVVVDGVPQNNQKQLKMNLFDIERIEVLKGPQGALYGRNAIGGAINIETRRPGEKTEGFVGAGFGEGGSREVSGGVSGTLVDKTVLFRVAGLSKRSDGQITNSFLQQKVDGIDHDNSLRAKLLILPSDGLQIDLRASSTDFSAGATYDSVIRKGNPSVDVSPRGSLLGYTDGHTDDASIKVDFDFAAVRLTSITGYTKLTERYRGDLDFSNPLDMPGGFLGFGFQAGQGQNLGVRMLSQELRLTSPDNQPLRWIGGLYFLDTKRDLTTHAFIDSNGSLAQWDDMPKVIVNNAEGNHNKASALFGQVDVDFSKSTTLSAALRYDRDQRQQTDLNAHSSREASFSKWQPKLTLTEKYSRDTLAYATVSTGFRSGGFNAPGIADFKPETLTNYEVGYKTVALNGTLMLNTALFASRSKGFQYFLVDAAKGAQIITNIDRVNLRGLDIDFRWQLAKGLTLDGGLGITDSNIKANAAEPATVGHRTPKNVPFKTNLGLQYSVGLGGGISGSLRIDWEHRDKKYWHPDNVAVSPALDLLGLRVGIQGPQDRWSVSLVGRNLGNKQYYADYNSGNYSGLPYDLGWKAQPRWLGLEGKYRF